MDINAAKGLIDDEPSLRSGELGLLIAVFLLAIEGLHSNDSSDVSLARRYFYDDDGLFSFFCHEAGIEPAEVRKRINERLGRSGAKNLI